jgi:N,N'-diacetyllegionaminate synthase
MSTLGEIENAISVLEKSGTNRSIITILHANTQYPTPYEDVNLNALKTIADAFKVKVGYSDHTNGIEIPIAAVSLGASIIEKHFTLDRNMKGPDHKASLEPNELKQMILSIRNLELAMGNGIKKPSFSETKNIAIARKSIVAKANIKIGDYFSEQNIAIKRPGNGISPLRWDEILGTVSQKNYIKDDLI